MTNDDGGSGIARRKVLAAAAGVGGLGLAGGLGSAALLRDEESLTGLFGSGTLELDVAWDEDGQHLTAKVERSQKSGEDLLNISLPGSKNNPAHVWFQPTCPDEAELADSLELDIYESNENGDRESLVISGSLRNLAEQSGTKLRFDGADCLDPNTTEYLLVEWEYTENSAGFDGADFDLKFFAEQCRNNDGPTNPYDPRSCAEPAGKDISWVAFCAESGRTLTDEELSFSVTGDTLDLISAPEELATVVLKYGTEIRVFDQPGTSGTFTTTTGGMTYEQNTGNGNGGNGNGSTFQGSDRTGSEPCPGTCGLKYEGSFESPSSRGCNS